MQDQPAIPQTKNIVQALWRLEKIILDTLDFSQVTQKICDGLLTELGYLDLGYRIIVLTLVNEDRQILERIALSQTDEARRAQEVSAVPFHDISIPLSAKENLLINTIETGQPHITNSWPGLFTPVLSPEQAEQNQQAAGISTSMVYPVTVKEKTIGAVIFSMVKEENQVTDDEKELLRGFCDVIGLAVQNARLYTRLESTTEELRQANVKLKELDKLKDEFVSIASHELRTPMTAIRSYLWMVLAGKGGEVSDKQKYYLERSYAASERLIKLINDMLNVSRIESGRIGLDVDRVDMAELCKNVIAEVRPRADELGLQVELGKQELEGEQPFVVAADADKLIEVLINLVGNSFKFTQQGGKITMYLEKKEGMVITHVTDTGVGIDPENVPNLFKKFGFMKGSYRTNQDATQGTGLGLYISKSIIDLHHGNIWAYSEGKGAGATFSFGLPEYSEQLLSSLRQEHADKSNPVGIIHSTVEDSTV